MNDHSNLGHVTHSDGYVDITVFGVFHDTSDHTMHSSLHGGRTAITTEALVAYNGLRAFLDLEPVDLETVGAWAFDNNMTNNDEPYGDDLLGVGLYFSMQGAKVGWIRDDAYDPQILADIQRIARLGDVADVLAMIEAYGHAGLKDHLEHSDLIDAFINTLKMEPHYGGWMHGRVHGVLGFQDGSGDIAATSHDLNHLTVLSHDQTQPFMNDTFDWPQWPALDISDRDVIEYFQSMVELGNPRGENLLDAPVAPPLAGPDILGTANDDTLNGSAYSDVIAGEAGDDAIDAGAGHDVLYGNSGADTLSGGTGSDKIYGGDDDDAIKGGSSTDTLYGDAGNDLIIGGKGADRLFGGDGNDTMYGNTGEDDLRGGAGNDTISGGAGMDLIYGNAGDDYLIGGGSFDTIYGGSGKDELRGSTGADTLYGDDGADALHGGTGFDRLYGGAENDSLYGNEGNDSLYGGTGDDYLAGATGNDILSGGDGDDVLFANQGLDILDGGAGDDTLAGGSLADVFIYEEGHDIITDMSFDDLVRLDSSLWSGSLTVQQIFNRYGQQQENGFTLNFGPENSLQFLGVTDGSSLIDQVEI